MTHSLELGKNKFGYWLVLVVVQTNLDLKINPDIDQLRSSTILEQPLRTEQLKRIFAFLVEKL